MPDDNIERVGVNAVEAIFLNEFKWAFRAQSVSDYGIDAIVEAKDGDQPTGKLIALQIKSGTSYFKKRRGNYVFYGELRHLDYWTMHSLSVFLVLYNPEDKIAVWQKIDRSLAQVNEKGWSIMIPITNVLNKSAKRFIENGIASDDASVRRFYFAVDLDKMRLFAGQDAVFFIIDDWVNKSLNIRGIQVYFDDHQKEQPDLEIPHWAAGYSIYEFMQRCFPWLTYGYAEPIENHAGEVDQHILSVELSKEARMFMELEDFYQTGPDYDDPEVPVDEDELSEEEQNEQWIRRAMEKDPWD